MSSKKKRKSSCPFASANRADVFATRVIQSKIDGRTIPLVLAGRKLKERQRRTRRTGLPRVVTNVSCSNNCCQRSPARKSLEICFFRFCHAYVYVTLLENVSARSGLRSCWIVTCQNEDCLSRTVHFSDHKFLGAFAFRSCNFLIDICTRTSPKASLDYATLFPCLRHLPSCFIRRNVNPH